MEEGAILGVVGRSRVVAFGKFCLQLQEGCVVGVFFVFKGIEHADSAVDCCVENGIIFLIVNVACLYGGYDLATVERHEGVEFGYICQLIVYPLGGGGVKLFFYSYINERILSDSLLTKRLPNLSPPAITP